uniref:Uncharacterized protein n=1 Tax=Rhizophora mucronata TaxID=61149 RepID=A0A2P2QR62_RHIMU
MKTNGLSYSYSYSNSYSYTKQVIIAGH